ncbi:unnamed protein product [Ilex paraguariensis]|uniref:ZF-HD dimerization-type domain-containing protein n=1 Tax=Ilex paraguariensis TaxID=185542 RepID=A0ABC8UDY4_9AQUA
MELTTTATYTTTTAVIKTPEAESEAPNRIRTCKPLTFTNGVLKRHHTLHQLHHNHKPPALVTYKECLKNHAASSGGHAVDGCGEFMPSPTATPTEPTSLKCAACGCHRNFHRRDPEKPLQVQPPDTVPIIEYQSHHRHHPPPPPRPLRDSSPNSPSPPPISSSFYPSAPHMLIALSTGLSGPSPDNYPTIATTDGIIASPISRKRFRTKFTRDQKEKMLELAQRIGWKMQKRNEDLVNEFCSELGVEKGVFKVWMHNNKNTFCKRENANLSDNNGNVNGINYHDLHHVDDKDNHHQIPNPQLHNSSSVEVHVVQTNGSCSS